VRVKLTLYKRLLILVVLPCFAFSVQAQTEINSERETLKDLTAFRFLFETIKQDGLQFDPNRCEPR